MERDTKKNPILLIVSLYLSLLIPFTFLGYVTFLDDGEGGGFELWVLILIGLLTLVVLFLFCIGLIMNIFNSMRLARAGDTDTLSLLSLKLKLILIPFFVLNFAAYAFPFLLVIAVSRGLGIILLPIPIFLAWCSLLATSVYSLPLIVLLEKEKRLTTFKLVVYFISQISFVLDIIGVVLLRRRLKKNAGT